MFISSTREPSPMPSVLHGWWRIATSSKDAPPAKRRAVVESKGSAIIAMGNLFQDIGARSPNSEQEPILEISFHAMAYTNHPQTIRVLSKLKNKEVIVLIDGGSTHNFIDQSIATQFGLPIYDKNFQVTEGNTKILQCTG
ncbi:hypothetical protein ACOSP7_027167 [Xanthoceras sorbifolium]